MLRKGSKIGNKTPSIPLQPPFKGTFDRNFPLFQGGPGEIQILSKHRLRVVVNGIAI